MHMIVTGEHCNQQRQHWTQTVWAGGRRSKEVHCETVMVERDEVGEALRTVTEDGESEIVIGSPWRRRKTWVRRLPKP